MGRAVGDIPDADSGSNPRVVNTELYEINAPPGKRVGAVSGAGPCAPERGAPIVAKSDSNTKKRQNIFREFKRPPKNAPFAHTCAQLPAPRRTDQIRRGKNADGLINGGAGHEVENASISLSGGAAAPDAVSVAIAASACVVLCIDDGCTTGACMDGIDLQQSWPLCPCGAHGIELQHCVASSGVVIAPQSSA